MKRFFSILFALAICFSGCSKENDSLNQGLLLRNRLQSASGCSFPAVVTADYGDKLYTFSVDCTVDESGKLSFCITEPETISGITGFIERERSALTFDDEVLAFPQLADGEITPVSAPWILINTLKSGYLTACGETEEGYKLLLDDSYADESLQLEVYTDKELKPYFCEILWQGRRVLSIKISAFEFL